MSKISIVSLGCPKNLVDTDNLITVLQKEGFFLTSDEKDADVVLVNTCGFIEAAKRESIEEILKLRRIKDEGKKLLVFGCLAKRYGNELIREIPEIDALWGVGEDDRIVEYCKSLAVRKESGKPANQRAKRLRTGDYRLSTFPYAYLKIAEGCSRGCTYCVIPSIRGPYRSVEPAKVLRKAEEHIAGGAKELILIAQDLGSYAREIKGYSLSSLVRDIASISGDFWIRLLYVNPSSVNDELMSVMANSNKVCRYLDMPLQHSEDRILKAMGRAGTKKLYARIIRKIREAIPGIALRTTFMVGFPGETDKDFFGLRDFVEDIGFDRLGVFTYSREEGTPASKLKGHLPERTKEQRRDEIMRIQARISLEKNMALIGKRFRAIVDEVAGDTAIARLPSQSPEIDGVVYISEGGRRNVECALRQAQGDNVMVSLPTGQAGLSNQEIRNLPTGQAGPKSGIIKVGEFVDIEITGAYDYDLKGELVR
ncbi:MAG TPA: 30S ribosomal protein S12 methylthiotransferase RimO [Thermodesulfovibrionales bacterium]|nr:30S ribosomal protein S12 methylthiotransferase RimO [Thermodesulfovibrionales bacterium]